MAESKRFLMNKSDLSPIEKAVQENLQQFMGEVSHPRFVVAVSGGMDSMCLLYIFKKLRVSGLVSHINYQKRGKASDKDAELVEKLSFEWGFDCHTATADPSEAEDQNFQQWARDFRYDVFRQLAKEHNAHGIAVAHHDDDQVETIIQKMFRGAGLASWSGMEVWDGEIFRPLLDISRTQIEEYVEKNAIPYRTDESNLEADFARNFLRNEWLQELSDFFPGWKTNVLRISDYADNYTQALGWISDRVTDAEGIKRESFHTLEPELQKALILHLIKQQKPAIQISHDSLNRVEELQNLQTGKGIELTAQCSVLRDRAHYVIELGTETEFDPVIVEREKLVETEVHIGELCLTVEGFRNPNLKESLYLDADKLSWPLQIRRWKDGDAFQPLGMEGHQQVSDHLTNRKISAAHKNRALVVESFEETICAIIFPPIKNQRSTGSISEKVKCDSETQQCLKITHRN